MKLRNLSYILILFSFIAAYSNLVQAQDEFEGKVTINVFDGDQAHTMEYYVKGSKIRFDANEEGHEGHVIMDPSNKQFLVVMPQQKMYMSMQIPDYSSNSGDNSSMDKDVSFEKTGETKQILGYTAEKWTYKSKDDQGEAWMTKDIGGFKMFDNPMQKNKPQWQKDLATSGYFPLEVYENGKKVYEVTNIDKKSLDESMFEAPVGFKKMDMPMMQK